MYLECLALLSTLLECQNFETKPNLFQDTNVQFLVAMSIKHGNTGKNKGSIRNLVILSIIQSLKSFYIFQINAVWRCH